MTEWGNLKRFAREMKGTLDEVVYNGTKIGWLSLITRILLCITVVWVLLYTTI